MNDHDQDEGSQPLTAEAFTELLYRQVAFDDAFDAIEGTTRRTTTEFTVHPFDIGDGGPGAELATRSDG